MKQKTQEAIRIESDYLDHVRNALSNLPSVEIEEIIQDVHSHIADAMAEIPDEEISMAQMASILETIGAPESFAEKNTSESNGVPANIPDGRFDIGTFFNDAIEIYKANLIPLVAAAILAEFITVFSLLILAGPISGGFYFMCLKAIRREDKHLELGDLFSGFSKCWPLAGLFFIQFIPIVVGFIFLLIPGLLLAAAWMYTELLMMDKDEGILSSLDKSFKLVQAKGFGLHFLLAVIVFVMMIGPTSIPYIGWLLGFLLRLWLIFYQRLLIIEWARLAIYSLMFNGRCFS